MPADTVGAHLAQHVLYVACAALLLAPAVFGAGERAAAPSRAIERFLGHAIMAWLGVVSYGVFLWHQPLYDNVIARHVVDRVPGAPFAAGVVATVAGAVALAAASYYGLERWFLRLKDPRPREGRAAAPARSIAG